MSSFVSLGGVAYATPDGRTLFDNLDIDFGPERTGIVGANGTGKSTLLRLAAGRLRPSAGSVVRRGSVAWLDQTVGTPTGSVADILGVADALARLDRIAAGRPHGDDLAEADWSLEARIGEALAAVGLAETDPRREVGSLSGGQRTRLRLAALVLADPDLILLDEPTNDLDRAGRDLVAALLVRRRGGAVVVSHDRAFLRGLDRIVEIGGRGVAVFGGGFDAYRAEKTERTEAAERAAAAADLALRRVERETRAALERKARSDARGARSRAKGGAPKLWLDAQQERAEASASRGAGLRRRLEAEAEARAAAARARLDIREAVRPRLPEAEGSTGRIVLRLAGVGWTAPDGRAILAGLDLTIRTGDRVAVVGPNGAGKSTLLALAAGHRLATAGTVERHGGRVVLLDQHVALLDPSATVFEAMRHHNPDMTDNVARAALARFLFRNAAADRRIGTLSGGETLRAGLACTAGGTTAPDLMILDEPTNHLDLDAIAAIEGALAAYRGALLVTSHDEDFLAVIGIGHRVTLGPSP